MAKVRWIAREAAVEPTRDTLLYSADRTWKMSLACLK